MIAEKTCETPIGPITLTDIDGAIGAVDWGPCADPHPSALLDRASDQVRAYFAGELTIFDLPLAPQGSPFQRKVWDQMLEIPLGETRTYGDVAHVIGSAARAVGVACGRNPIPIVIPCHRIVGSGGRLTGYSGGKGLETKAYLLRHEGCLL